MGWLAPRRAILGLVLVSALTACSDAGERPNTSPAEVPTTDLAGERPQSADGDAQEVGGALDPIPALSAANLDQALNAYGQCLGEQLVVTLRFRADRFAGVVDDISLPVGVTDRDLIRRERERCGAVTNLDAVVAAAQSDNPLTDAQIRAIVEEYRTCMADVAGLESQTASLAEVKTLEDIDRSLAEMSQTAPSSMGGMNECRDSAVFGPIATFGQ